MIENRFYRRLRFYAGNCLRFVTIPWEQKWIRPDEATTIFGCSFGPSGWHHLKQTLIEYDSNPGLDWRESTLYLFLNQFCPTSICDLLDSNYEHCALPLFVYPWGTFRKEELAIKKDPVKSRFCGPSFDDFIKDEFDRLILLYKQLKSNGYKPWNFGHGFIGGTFLCRNNEDRRFVVLQGNHRMAILAHIGLNKVAVRNCPGYLSCIKESEISQLPLVLNGMCNIDTACQIFNLFFKQNGNNIFIRINSKR